MAREAAPSTKESILQEGIRLFSKYGYDGTSTRMIADAVSVNLSTLNFHFHGKENLYRACLEHVAQRATKYYENIYSEIQAAREQGTLEPQKAWELIERLIDLQLVMITERADSLTIPLLYWEQHGPEQEDVPITRVVQERCENALAYLLTQYKEGLDIGKARLISRYINGGIITYSEHPAFLKIMGEEAEPPSHALIKSTLKEYILSNIQCYCSRQE